MLLSCCCSSVPDFLSLPEGLSGRTDLFPEQHSGLVSGIRAVLVAQEDDMDPICYSVFKPQNKDEAGESNTYTTTVVPFKHCCFRIEAC